MNVSEQATGLYSNGSKQWLAMFVDVIELAQVSLWPYSNWLGSWATRNSITSLLFVWCHAIECVLQQLEVPGAGLSPCVMWAECKVVISTWVRECMVYTQQVKEHLKNWMRQDNYKSITLYYLIVIESWCMLIYQLFQYIVHPMQMA